LTPDAGTSWQLPRLIGLRKAQEMNLTNRRITASEGELMGQITRAIDDSKLAAEDAATARRFSQAATGALGGARALLLSSFSSGLENHLE
jgi:2-(1,2-epoxy-1,2-dihydrophenyl)acetyl-CoA isomerase